MRIVGVDGSNTLEGTAGADLIYGFDPAGPQAQVSAIRANLVAAGFTQPLFVTAPPADYGRLFVVEQGGDIHLVDLTGSSVLASPFLDVSAQISTAGEQGLLGLAFDPAYATNGFFYVNLTNAGGDTEIRRYQVFASDRNVADLPPQPPRGVPSRRSSCAFPAQRVDECPPRVERRAGTGKTVEDRHCFPSNADRATRPAAAMQASPSGEARAHAIAC